MKVAYSRILCVGDDADTCEWIVSSLKGAQIKAEITCVDSGHDAIEMLKERGFDLCIMEYALPGMTGAQLCSYIRYSGYDVPVMFFTATDRQIDKDNASAAGANEFLCKPDDHDIFVPAVLCLLKRRRAIYAPFPIDDNSRRVSVAT